MGDQEEIRSQLRGIAEKVPAGFKRTFDQLDKMLATGVVPPALQECRDKILLDSFADLMRAGTLYAAILEERAKAQSKIAKSLGARSEQEAWNLNAHIGIVREWVRISTETPAKP